jgi:hypothetical protein
LSVAITLISIVLYQLWPTYRRSSTTYMTLIVQPLTWPDLIWLGLLPGLSEELLFRGVMLPAIGLTWTGVIISSLCFGVLHLGQVEQWPYALWACIVGVCFGVSVLLTGHMLVAIVAHIATNLLCSIYWKIQLYRTADET